MKTKYFFLLIINVLLFQSQVIAQSNNLPDLVFEKAIKGSTENEPIALEITVKNIGDTVSKPTKLSVDLTYRSVLKTDIERLNLKPVESDYYFQAYRIEYNIPVLKPNENAVFKLNLDKRLDEDCSFLIVIDRENKLEEANKNNNKTAFPATELEQYNLFPDLIIKEIQEPEYDYDTKGTLLTIEIENIGFAAAENVTLEVWEIVVDLSNLPERDLRAILGDNWWIFAEGGENYESSFDLLEELGTMEAGTSKVITLAFDGWVYNPNCKIGAKINTTSEEDNKSNNAASMLKGG